MEADSSSYSSSKSAYSSQNPEEAKGLKHAYSLQSHSLLHSVRKSQTKPWKKAPVAPPLPTPVKVYKVHPMNFRDLVQQLTGAPEFKPPPDHHQLLQRVTPAAISHELVASLPYPILPSRDIAAASSLVCTNNWHQDVQSEALGAKSQVNTSGTMAPGLLELNLSSPSSYNWCSFPPMSPGTRTSMEPGWAL